MKILDCTLRDGGYYTGWDFDRKLVVDYAIAMNKLPIQYIEIGYRGGESSEYLGEYYYCPRGTIETIKEYAPEKLIAVMLDSKNIKPEEIEDRLSDSNKLIDLIRIASSPENLDKAIAQAKELKRLGFKVAINVMYASKIKADSPLFSYIDQINQYSDYLYLVDSYGGMLPEEVKEVFNRVSENISVELGFHGHNNLELALINSLTALESGATIIDSTITGMGRGAGNLKTELLLTTLKSRGKLDFLYSDLTDITSILTEMCEEYKWGVNYPYMITGAYSLPQSEVMSLLAKQRYSFDTILRHLLGSEETKSTFAELTASHASASKILIIGGGESISRHQSGLIQLLEKNKDMLILFSSSKKMMELDKVNNSRILCLQGNECGRLNKKQFNTNAIDYYVFPEDLTLSDYSFKEIDQSKCFSIPSVLINESIKDAPLSLAIETCKKLQAKSVYLAGFDGYMYGDVKSRSLHTETQKILDFYMESDIKLESLTESDYANVNYRPLYSLI